MQWLIDIVKEWLQLYLKGMIVVWSGAIVDIPDGWQLCDGTNGTPDLRDNFVRGAGGIYNPGDTGGTSKHDHTVDSHRHTRTRTRDAEAGDAKYSVSDPVTGYESPGTDEVANIPPYYALAYIMKL
ncbi:hypothetical protein ES703_61565 [subsurface metagenome]